VKSSETSTLFMSQTLQSHGGRSIPVAIGREGDHTVTITGREVGESNTTREHIGHWRREQRFNFSPDSWRRGDTSTMSA